MSPTQRSLKSLRAAGFLAGVTERWNGHARIRQDLFGFIDLIAVKGDLVVAVQSTSGSNVSARIAKIKANPAAKIWSASPHRLIAVHGWRKAGARGKRKLWQCREEMVTFQ